MRTHPLTSIEPLNADVTNRWFKATGKMIREGFGQTEGPVLVATYPWVEPRPGSMGKPSPLLNIKLLDGEGQRVEDGEEGNICVTGLKEHYPPGLFVGYYRNDEATATSVGGEYYNLSDVAWSDPDGYYTFVGRSDDVIKCSGYRIGPFEVESALVAHPSVIECAVTAAPDEVRGNVVKYTVSMPESGDLIGTPKPGTYREAIFEYEYDNHPKPNFGLGEAFFWDGRYNPWPGAGNANEQLARTLSRNNLTRCEQGRVAYRYTYNEEGLPETVQTVWIGIGTAFGLVGFAALAATYAPFLAIFGPMALIGGIIFLAHWNQHKTKVAPSLST